MPRPTRPRAIPDEAKLGKAALDYIARYASSSETLRRVLLRRVMRAAPDNREAVDALRPAIDTIVARLVASGLVNDAAYAQQLAASLHRRGVSAQGMRGKLKEKGLGGEDAQAAMDALKAEGMDDLAAAVALARRRRIGPFRVSAAREGAAMRDLGILARAGFSLAIARRVIEADDVEALEGEVVQAGRGGGDAGSG